MTTRNLAATAAAMSDDESRDASASAAAVLAALGSAGDASTKENPDAALLALRLRWEEARALQNDAPSPRSDELSDQVAAVEKTLIGEIVALPARTMAGLAFKAEVSAAKNHGSPEIVASIMADIATNIATDVLSSTKATFEDFAAMEFPAIAECSDLGQIQQTFDSQWGTLAFAFQMLTLDHDEAAKFAGRADANGDFETLEHLVEAFEEGASWFRQTSEVMTTAQVRLLSGMSRFSNARQAA